jgi:CheY-like chemotaxis protein
MTGKDDSLPRDRRKKPRAVVRPLAAGGGRGATIVPNGRGTGAATPAREQKARNPRATARSGSPAATEHPIAPVVIASADPSLLRMLTFALRQMHLEFREVSSGSVALSELANMEVGARPPVVILDVDLPGMDGYSVLERIGTDRPDTFLILVLSSHADESVQVRTLLSGAVDHLAKPFNVRVLMAKVQRWVAMSARLADRKIDAQP